MSNHLEKAKGALEEAKKHDGESRGTAKYCMEIAQTQAAVASAEALERIADALCKKVIPQPINITVTGEASIDALARQVTDALRNSGWSASVGA